MKLVVLGASGRCGRWVVEVARSRGHSVTAVARPGSSWQAPGGVTTAFGDVTNPHFVRDVLAGHRLVLSCIGLRRAGSGPWAGLRSPPDLVRRVTANVIEAVRDRPGLRLIWLSAGGVGSSRARTSWPLRLLLGVGSLGAACRDLEGAEALLAHASIDATAVRPVTLRGGEPTWRAGPVRRYGLLSTVRRADVAAWMVDLAEGKMEVDGPAVLLGRGAPAPGSA